MELVKHYLVLLRKGPAWTPGTTPELEALQVRHRAHIDHMHEIGVLLMAGPVEAHADSDLRGIQILRHDALESPEELRELIEQDPAIQAGRLRAEYSTWWHAPGTTL